MTIIDKLSYKSSLANSSVGEKLLFSMIPLILSLIFSSYILFVTIIIVMAFASLYWGKVSFSQYKNLLMIPFGFIFLGVITIMINVLSMSELDILFAVKIFEVNIGITTSSLLLGLQISLKALSCVSCFYFLTINTPMNNIFSFMQKHKVSQTLVDLMELIYRFSFLIWNEAGRIHQAQMARLGYKDFKTSIQSLAELVTMIFENSLNRVERINNSLESRCFNGKFSYLLENSQNTKSIKTQIIICNVFLALIIILERL